MAASTVVKNMNDGSMSLADGTATPVTHTVDFDVGDIQLSGLAETLQEVVAYESRGVLKSVRHTTRTYPTFSASIMMTDVSDDVDATVIDFLLKQNSFSANASTIAGGVYCVDITFTVEGTDVGDDEDHTIVLEDVHITLAIAEGDPNTITLEGTVYGTVTMT